MFFRVLTQRSAPSKSNSADQYNRAFSLLYAAFTFEGKCEGFTCRAAVVGLYLRGALGIATHHSRVQWIFVVCIDGSELVILPRSRGREIINPNHPGLASRVSGNGCFSIARAIRGRCERNNRSLK